MSGMLLKDWYILKSVGKSYLGVIAIFAVLTFTGAYDIPFFSAMFVMLLTMMPVTGFAYDEQAGWDKYAVATPAGRVGVVRGKYLLSFLLWVASILCTAVLTAIACTLHPAKFILSESIVSSVVVASAGLMMLDILLPLVFRFGSQKSRVMLMAVVGVLVGLGVALSMLLEQGGLSAPLQLVGVLLPVIGLGGFAISYFTSLSIFQKKEL